MHAVYDLWFLMYNHADSALLHLNIVAINRKVTSDLSGLLFTRSDLYINPICCEPYFAFYFTPRNPFGVVCVLSLSAGPADSCF